MGTSEVNNQQQTQRDWVLNAEYIARNIWTSEACARNAPSLVQRFQDEALFRLPLPMIEHVFDAASEIKRAGLNDALAFLAAVTTLTSASRAC